MNVEKILHQFAQYKIGNLPDGVFKFEKDHDGCKVAILCCVHGNESIGIDVFSEIIPILYDKIQAGKVTVILVNIDAIMENKRFIDIDMNRLLSEKSISNLINRDENEAKRLIEILPFIKNCDILLDIHSTIRPSVPFIYCENTSMHNKIAEFFNIDYKVCPGNFDKNDEDLFSSFDSFIDRNGGCGITIECGCIDDVDKISPMNGIINILANYGIISNDNIKISPKKIKKTFIIYDKIIANNDNFAFLDKNIVNFAFYKKGQILAKDDGNIYINEDSYIIFPKKDIKKGYICCFLARNE